MTKPRQHRRYSIYRHRRRVELCCAILEGSGEPDFMEGDAWIPVETLDLHRGRPEGFDESAAAFSCALQGFYIFHWGRERHAHAASNRMDRRLGRPRAGL